MRDPELINELENNRIKFSKNDLIFIARDSEGQVVWLENGNSGAGLIHLLDGDEDTPGHADDFKRALGISRDEIPAYLFEVVAKGKVVKIRKRKANGRAGLDKIYYYQGAYHLLCGVGTNGFIVTAHPYVYKEKK